MSSTHRALLACTSLAIGVCGLARTAEAQPEEGNTSAGETSADEQPQARPAQSEEPYIGHEDAVSGATPQAYGEDDALIEELLGAEDEVLDVPGHQLQLYGFADFTYRRLSFDDGSLWNQSINNHGSFLLGNLNVYLRSDISSHWTSLSEVRFTFLPNGGQPSDAFVSGGGESSEFRDNIDPSDVVRVGGIIIERAWLEYRWNEHLRVRMGRWLTPYGIWNIDHGSPTLLASRQPFIVGSDFMPEAQTGVQVLGEHRYGDYRLQYFATLSNGRGPTDESVDLDDNKAVGATLRLHTPWLDEFSIGAASNYGRETFSKPEIVCGSSLDDSTSETVIESEADSLSLTADLRLRWRNVLFFGELVSQQVAYTDRGRPQQFVAPGTLKPDSLAVGGYGLLGYEFDWQGTIVWAAYETALAESVGTHVHSTSTGIVIRPLPQITLKASAYLLSFESIEERTSVLPKEDLHELDLQIAWVF